MRQQIKYKFFLPAIGGKLLQEWDVSATHVHIEHPTFDLLGDPANMPDIEERLENVQISEMTGGAFLGLVSLKDISTELRMQIIEQGKKLGRAQIAEFFKTEPI